MRYTFIYKLSLSILLINNYVVFSQQTILEVDISNTIAKIQPTMYGVFFEDINFAADGGLYAEMIKNRSFEFDEPLMGWKQPNTQRLSLNKNSGIAHVTKYSGNTTNHRYCRVIVHNPENIFYKMKVIEVWELKKMPNIIYQYLL